MSYFTVDLTKLIIRLMETIRHGTGMKIKSDYITNTINYFLLRNTCDILKTNVYQYLDNHYNNATLKKNRIFWCITL